LFVLDDAPGDGGMISNGWSLQLTTKSPIPVPLTLSGYTFAGEFYITVNGNPGSTYVVLASSNLTTWTPVITNTPASGTFTFTEGNGLGSASRFYRAQQQTP
jgi:hypothetical protein